MEVADIRREKLRQYIKENFRTRAEFAEKIGKSPAQVSMWFMKKNEGKRDIGEKLAREIEKKLGLPKYWMDQRHDEVTDGSHASVSPQIIPNSTNSHGQLNTASLTIKEIELLELFKQLDNNEQDLILKTMAAFSTKKKN